MDYSSIATRLIEKNRDKKGTVGSSVLEKVVNANPDSSYKKLEEHITSRLCASVGRAEDSYVQRRKLIWAVIDAVNGEGESLVY